MKSACQACCGPDNPKIGNGNEGFDIRPAASQWDTVEPKLVA